jgi:DNA-binding CsgD family transcriptional regulator/tetratricopeptide (TPR) repeat protein
VVDLGGCESRSPRLLERETELATLAAALADTSGGHGRIVVIEGPAGIGKTALLDWLRHQAVATGAYVLGGRGAEIERGFPFGVCRQLFERPLANAPADHRASLLTGAASLAGHLFGLGDPPAPTSDPAFATVHGLYWLCSNLAEEAPVVLTVDDVHHADATSLRFFAYLAPRLEALSALLALAVRPAELPGGASNELFYSSATTVVAPRELSPQAVSTVVRARFPRGSDGLCRACHTATAGNPFLLASLLEAIETEEAAAPASIERLLRRGSVAVGRTVLARLARLPRACRRLVQAAAVLGSGAELSHAASLAELDLAAAATALEELARHQILIPGCPLRFVHPLIESAVLASLPDGAKAVAHEKAARLLDELGCEPARAAAHLLDAYPAGDPWVVRTLQAAAGAAMRAGGPGEAARYLRRALEEPTEAANRAVLLHQVGIAEVLSHDPHAMDDLGRALQTAGDPRVRAGIALDLGRCLVVADRPRDALPLLERAIDELGDMDPDLTTRLEADLLLVAYTSRSTWPVFRRHLARVRGRPVDQSPSGRLLLATLAAAAFFDARPAQEVRELAERALGAGELLAELGPEAPLLYATINALAFADWTHAAIGWFDRAVEESQRRGSIIGFALASCMRSLASWRLGSLADAEADARTALDHGARGSAIEPLAMDVLTAISIERGAMREAAQFALPCAQRSLRSGDLPALFGVYARGRLRAAGGDFGGAFEDFTHCGRWFGETGLRSPGLMPWQSSSAVACARIGHQERAIELVERELDAARTMARPRPVGIATHAAGLVRADIDLLRQAVNILAESDDRLEHARALTDYGAALRRGGHRIDAREPLRLALDLAVACGATVVACRAREELIAAGARPHRQRITGLHALTASERRVAAMAADGMTNREIAQALFITTKTVAHHLTHTYSKLDIEGRNQLPNAMKRGCDGNQI